MEKTNFDFLSDIDFLQKVSVDTLECLASECQLKELAVGEALFQDGEEGDSCTSYFPASWLSPKMR